MSLWETCGGTECECHGAICPDCGCTNEADAPRMAGYWVATGDDEVTAEQVEGLGEVLKRAYDKGEQVVVHEGLSLEWKAMRSPPITHDGSRRIRTATEVLGRASEIARMVGIRTDAGIEFSLWLAPLFVGEDESFDEEAYEHWLSRLGSVEKEAAA